MPWRTTSSRTPPMRARVAPPKTPRLPSMRPPTRSRPSAGLTSGATTTPSPEQSMVCSPDVLARKDPTTWNRASGLSTPTRWSSSDRCATGTSPSGPATVQRMSSTGVGTISPGATSPPVT
ncbi:hypothetical protein [Ornithinimicrobium kibberense]|uniref:hypothetical protein n=1 Tax=Ornithinimicrobium kibberense TaxID=282060 RepID=UPI00361BD883